MKTTIIPIGLAWVAGWLGCMLPVCGSEGIIPKPVFADPQYHGSCDPEGASPAQKKNVLMILVDDLKPAFGAYGAEFVHSPNLDRLAARGMRFDRAYCNQAVCAPSRNNLMVGLRSTTLGVYGLSQGFRSVQPDAVTLTQYFMQHGYQAEGVGKVFHMGHGNRGDDASWSVPFHPEKVVDYVLEESTGGQLTREEAYFSNAGVRVRDLPRGAAWEKADVNDDAYADGRIADEGMRRLRRFKQRGEPFFLALGFVKPHLPFCAPSNYWDLYDPSGFDLTNRNTPPEGAPPYAGKSPQGEIANYKPIPPDGDIPDVMARTLIHGYFASLSYMDAQVGRVLDELDRLGFAENTIIALWGDHGWHFGDHGTWTKHTNYEQDTRIPLVFAAPGVAEPGSSTGAFAETVDIYPTLVELAELPAPQVPQGLDGQSLVPVLKDPGASVRDHAYHAYQRGPRIGRAIRTDRYRMVEWKQAGAPEDTAEYELYDYQVDALEKKNLAASHPEVLVELKAILARHPEARVAGAGRREASEVRREGSLPMATEKEGVDVMLTEWGASLQPDRVWQQYPRPQLRRDAWVNLNGLWEYAVTDKTADLPASWSGTILVPFAIESALSGVRRSFTPDDALWYRREVFVEKQPGRRYRLNFEAVDYASQVWVNGEEVGSNIGGSLPFSFDVTDALTTGNNEIRLRVTDATDAAGSFQLTGKQRLTPKGIWYTPVSGIWQTVWLEEVPEAYLTSLKVDPLLSGEVRIAAQTSGPAEGKLLEATVRLNGKLIAEARGQPGGLSLNIPDPEPWSPASPVLYDLELRFGEDAVASYFGIREIGTMRDDKGHMRMTLNGEPLFHFGTLDQGWWPDGLLTPPSYEAMCFDIDFLKAAGFNTIRKHIKVEPRTYYHYCDQVGMLVWQDQVSGGKGPDWTRLQPDPVDATWPAPAHQQYLREFKGMVDGLYNHPSIVMWIPFNERWGQHRTLEVGRWIVHYDPSRWVNIASGGNFWPVGDVVDAHTYPHPRFPFEQDTGGRFDDYVKVMGEFGGHGFPVQGHLWDSATRNWGYGGLPNNKDEWIERYRTSIRMLNELRGQGIAGGIYTQTTDVEGEINGLLTYDRKVAKVPAPTLAAIHRQLFVPSPPTQTLLPVSATGWRYVTRKPDSDWMDVSFDDTAWPLGRAGFGTRKTPGIQVGTLWDTEEIWLRRAFEWDEVDGDGRLMLRIFHDEDAAVYLNGTGIAELSGYVTSYTTVPLEESAIGLLRKGRNVLAIHVRQTDGGQGADAGLQWTGATTVAPAMPRAEIEAGLKSHDRALYIKEGWIRDPYIVLGPDDHYYLTGTTIHPGDPREATDPYNTGLGHRSAVGQVVRVWRSQDLIDWESLGTPFTLKDDSRHEEPGNRVWAPELHWLGDRWALVHCPQGKANFALSKGQHIGGPWQHPMGANLGAKHDPSLFQDGETWWMLWGNTTIAPLSEDLSRFTAEPARIDPSGSRTNALGQTKSVIGHEGATLRKIGEKYVHFGTAWSTDQMRQGSYNLYYCTADRITGPYGPRRFAGRFLGHGTPFQTRDGKWWCTAFFNANVPPLDRDGIETRDLSETAQTINQRGTTIVPLEVRIQDDGDVYIRARDPAYATPGPEEAQAFP